MGGPKSGILTVRPYLDTVARITVDDTWLLRRLVASEVADNADEFTRSNLVRCRNAHSVYDEFESLYVKADEFKPVLEVVSGVERNANSTVESAIKFYKIQVKRGIEEIIADVDAQRISPAEAKLRAAFLRQKLVNSSLGQASSISRAVISYIGGDNNKGLQDVLNNLAVQKYNRSYRYLPVLEKTEVVRDLSLKAANALYKAENLQQAIDKLGRVGKVLKYFDIALTVARWLKSENVFADIIEDLTRLYAAYQARFLGAAASTRACVFGGPGVIIGCTVVIMLASGIAVDLATTNGIDLIKEWYARASGVFKNLVFWDWFNGSEPEDEDEAREPSGSPAESSPTKESNGVSVSNITVTELSSSNISVKIGQRITVSASGSIRLGPFAGETTPDGIEGFSSYNVVSGAPHGALLMRIKQSGQESWWLVGSRVSFVADSNGRLEFLVNDADTSNNSGSFHVKITVGSH